MIEGQLREAYARRHEVDGLTQSDIANALGINRAAIHNRLTGKCNMTIETIANMVWALGHDISVEIFDPDIRTETSFSEPTDEEENFDSYSLFVKPDDELDRFDYELIPAP